MSDLIRREDAIKALYKYNFVTKEVIEREIMSIPSADLNSEFSEWARHWFKDSADRPQGEWIPCSERLPSEQGQYLVTLPLCNGDPWVDVLSFCKGKFYETDGAWGDVEYDDVTAWMPLPEPWRGADDEASD